MFEKTKKFIKEHELEIAVALGVTITLAGGLIGMHIGHKHDLKMLESDAAMKNIYRVLMSIPEGTRVSTYGDINKEGIAAKDLGALGERMIQVGADELEKFTHFIAIHTVES